MLTSEQIQQIINYIEKMDNVKVTHLIGTRFMVESFNSVLPVKRVCGKLERRGAKIETAGNPKIKIIQFPEPKGV